MAVTISSEPRYFVGTDIGGTEAKSGLLKVDGPASASLISEIIKTHSSPSSVKKGPEYVTSEVVPNAVGELIRQANIPADLIEGITVDFPAAVDARNGIILDVANMEHQAWRNFQAGAALRRNLARLDGLQSPVVIIENDAAVTIRGVVEELPIPERRKSVFGLFVGTGIGGSAYVDGRNPFNNVSGGSEPGATRICFDEDEILLGKPGQAKIRSLEQFAALVAIERQLEGMARQDGIPANHEILKLQAADGKTLWRTRAEALLGFANKAFAGREFNDFSLRVFKLQAQVIGLYLQGLIQFTRPDHIFIGGGVVDSRRVSPEFAQWYVDGIRDAARNLIAQPARRDQGFPEFHIPKDGDFAAPKGAALMALDEYLRQQG